MTVVGKMDADYFELTVLDPESDVIDRAETKVSTDDGLDVQDHHIVWAHNFINKYRMPARMINMIAYKYACVEYLYDTTTDNCDAITDLNRLLVEMKEKTVVEMKEKSKAEMKEKTVVEAKPVDQPKDKSTNTVEDVKQDANVTKSETIDDDLPDLVEAPEDLAECRASDYETVECCEDEPPAKHTKKPAKEDKEDKKDKKSKKDKKPVKKGKKDKKPAKTDYNSNEDRYGDVEEEVCKEDYDPESYPGYNPSYTMSPKDPSIKDGCRLYGIRLTDVTISLTTLKNVTLSPSAVPQIRFMYVDDTYLEFPVSSFLEAERLVAVYKKHLNRYESVSHNYYYPKITFGRTVLDSYEIQYLKFLKATNTMAVSFNNSGTMSIICNKDEFTEYRSKLLDALKGNDSPIR